VKKIKFVSIFVAIILSIVTIYIYTINPTTLKKFNNSFLDMLFNIRGVEIGDKNIVIIDIDERSIKKLGHWPWRRDKIAQIVENLTNNGIAVIGFDMVFSEKEERSPKEIAKDLGIDSKKLKDYDKIFANSLANSPSILGFVFNMEHNFTNNDPMLNAIFVENGHSGDYILKAKGVTSNIKLLQESAYSSGSFNMIPDSDGVVRSVPMLFRYGSNIYPSLTLEMIRAMLGEQQIYIDYDEFGVADIRVGELTIPTDKYGRVFVNFRGKKGSYRYISALDIYENRVKRSELDGKIALIGTSAAGLLDLRSTPFDSHIPGVEIHANLIDNVLNGNFIQKSSNIVGINYLLIITLLLIVSVIMMFESIFISTFFLALFLGLLIYFFYYLLFFKGVVLNYIYPVLSIIAFALIFYIYRLYIESKQKEKILNKFSKKVSPAVAQTLIKSNSVDLEIDEREVTIFFSDIRNFTTISESFGDAKRLIDYLNRYMSPMSDIIIKSGGTIDKYIGDAIMAYWNAPLKVEDHADLALKASLEQLNSLNKLNMELERDGLPLIEIGVGIHTGKAVVGEMGSYERSDYTIIGESVNTASRIESLTKEFKANILISEDTKNALKQSYNLEPIGDILLKGMSKKVNIYKVQI